MEDYRTIQMNRWKKQQAETSIDSSTPPLVDEKSSIVPIVQSSSSSQAEPFVWRSDTVNSSPISLPITTSFLSTLVVDSTSLSSIRLFMRETGGGQIPRIGILYGAVSEDKSSIIVDSIYECAQDILTGEPLHDTRSPMVARLSGLMGLRPVGLLVSSLEVEPMMAENAADLVRLIKLDGAIAHAILIVSRKGDNHHMAAIVATQDCIDHVSFGTLTEGTTLGGRTSRGGLDGTTLQRPLKIEKRTVNQVIHTGFYRLNRPNHAPTMDDVRIFIIARRDKAHLDKLHLQLADYHLILFIADVLGESTAERVILAIFQEDDDLLTDLVGLLLNSTGDSL